MIENLSSKIDSLSGKVPDTVIPEVNEINPESLSFTAAQNAAWNENLIKSIVEIGNVDAINNPSFPNESEA